MTKKNHEGDLATVLREEVFAAAESFGLGPNISADLAAAAERRVRLRSGGDKVYIGKKDRRHRDAEIRRRYNGANEAELAREFDLSTRRIQQIAAA